jgi:hypothetical protein
VSDDRSDSYVAMPGIAVEANDVTVSDGSDHDIDIPGTAVEADATQINSSAKQTCGSMDLSWAFDMPLSELLNGHPNDQHRLPLRALAEGLVELANDKGIAISDRTLFQVLQGLENCIESYQKSMVNGSWEFKVTKMVIGGSDVLIQLTMRYAIMTERDYEIYYEEDHRLALRLRMKSGRASPLDRGLTFAACTGCRMGMRLSHKIFGDDLDRRLDSGETTVSCIILLSQLWARKPLIVV